ncbi:GDSL-type esterase/lipase family protein [Methylobacterium nonmethylotrophicum]|uniref:Lipolytic protein G-D-S-L family n=1 Tax=Methylobacterium nonmethylotrophicum TaxID=1141884 RepID=A0A4Z0NTW3_9HYPH|nr:GDSL-type esterase/lipase family protein [Methylobacterium nonmethylotrophicum]TGE00617.1 lipolytic protein G-D-S-L family [Methylobacterium nonmethylotrophicum]
MRLPGGRRGRLAAFGAAILLPVTVVALAPGADGETSVPRPAVAAVAPLRIGGAEAPPVRHARRAVSVLQIGDSHTAADQFTGTARRILQERFGAGGIGYLAAGTPHPGIRSTSLSASASAGWRYDSLKRATRPDLFGLSGYVAGTDRAGETLSFASEVPVAYTAIEIDARTGPGMGAVAVEVDGAPVLAASLAAGIAERKTLTVRPPAGSAGFRRLVIRTTEARPVAFLGVGIVRAGAGVTYSSLGVPGATIDWLGRYPEATLADNVRRLAPDIVVLAFGTNEGFDAGLDPAAYERRYAAVLRVIRRAVPGARLVMIGPPQAERAAPACKPDPARPCPADPAAQPPEGADACPWRPPQLDQVRAVQRRLAAAERIPFWDWWGIMPAGCGASRWMSADPPLMAKDRIHFTKAGYRIGGQAFAGFLEPELRALLRGDDAVSHH